MGSEELTPYRIEVGNRARRFLRRHHELRAEWEGQIRDQLAASPLSGPKITHLKGRFHCNRRWRESGYRILYEVVEDDRLIRVFDADTRGDIYQ